MGQCTSFEPEPFPEVIARLEKDFPEFDFSTLDTVEKCYIVRSDLEKCLRKASIGKTKSQISTVTEYLIQPKGSVSIDYLNSEYTSIRTAWYPDNIRRFHWTTTSDSLHPFANKLYNIVEEYYAKIRHERRVYEAHQHLEYERERQQCRKNHAQNRCQSEKK